MINPIRIERDFIMKKILAILFFSFIFCYLYGHKDRIIFYEKNGELVGLPQIYQPASFSLKSRTLKIGDNKIIIPDCVWSLFGKVKKESLKFGASWYHKSKTLPPYIHMRIVPTRDKSGYRLLFNLNTLKIIKLTKYGQSEESYNYGMPIQMNEICPKEKQNVKLGNKQQKQTSDCSCSFIK